MRLVFRRFPTGEMPPPGPGEVFIRPDPARTTPGQGVAASVLEHGVGVLHQGPGPAQFLVVDVSSILPTLDDMLAATFAEKLLDGQLLPGGCRAFAEYAAVVRRGLRPSDIPPEDAMEAIFLAIRNVAGKDTDLTDAHVGERFRNDWARMAGVILEAAAKDANPLKDSPFAGRPDFMGERAFLVRDREVYRQDVLRGARWRVRLPGGPERASGLLLRRPTSLLFPFWSRSDRDAPEGGAYLFLAVDWGSGLWVLSTDPVQRLPIASLAVSLQAAEAARDPPGAVKDPWYDGHRSEHGHTLVGSPRGGTKLSERAVLRTVKKWAQARAVGTTWRVREMVWAAVAATAVALLMLIYLKVGSRPNTITLPSPGGTVTVVQDGRSIPPSGVEVVVDPQTGQRDGVKVAEGLLRPNEETGFQIKVPPFTGDYNVPHGVAVRFLLRSPDRLAIAQVSAQINERPRQAVRFRAREGSDNLEIETEPIHGEFDYVSANPADLGAKKENAIRVWLQNSGGRDQRVEVQALWPADRTLYVLTVGVSKFANRSGNDLPSAAQDADELARAFSRQEGGPFYKVVTKKLTDAAATKKAILDELDRIREAATVYDFVTVTLAGHGDVYNTRYWYFAPSDYDPLDVNSSALFWTRGLDLLSDLKCDAFLLVDTCHSGAMTREVVRGSFGSGKRTLIVFAACLSQQKAQEASAWGHGALTLAVLEALQGKYLAPAPPGQTRPELPAERKEATDRITLFELQNYVVPRVDQLVSSGQSVVIMHPPDCALQNFAVAGNPKRR